MIRAVFCSPFVSGVCVANSISLPILLSSAQFTFDRWPHHFTWTTLDLDANSEPTFSICMLAGRQLLDLDAYPQPNLWFRCMPVAKYLIRIHVLCQLIDLMRARCQLLELDACRKPTPWFRWMPGGNSLIWMHAWSKLLDLYVVVSCLSISINLLDVEFRHRCLVYARVIAPSSLFSWAPLFQCHCFTVT